MRITLHFLVERQVTHYFSFTQFYIWMVLINLCHLILNNVKSYKAQILTKLTVAILFCSHILNRASIEICIALTLIMWRSWFKLSQMYKIISNDITSHETLKCHRISNYIILS